MHTAFSQFYKIAIALELGLDPFDKRMAEFRMQREQLRQEHSAQRSEKSNLSSKNNSGYNKTLLLPAIAALAMAPVVGWIALKQEPERIRVFQSDTPDPRYSTALNSPAADQLEVRISSLTGNMEKLSGLITDIESRLITTEKLEERVSDLTENLESLDTLTADLESRELAADKLENRISNMTKDLQLLSDLAAGIESKQMTALVTTNALLPGKQKLVSKRPQKPPAATNPAVSEKPIIASNTKAPIPIAAKKKPAPETKVASVPPAPKTKVAFVPSTPNPKPVPNNQTSKRETLRTPPKESGKSVANKQPSDSVPQNRPWNINLISTPDKVYAERFSEKAKSRGVRTELQKVTVRGIPYWRVQVTGFSTESVAKTYADNIKGKLDLKDTWVMRR